MRREISSLTAAAALLLGGCATQRIAGAGAPPIPVKIIAFNDFHGALEPPKLSVPASSPGGATVQVPAGGVAYLASAVARLRAENPRNLLVSAGDLISASPLISAQFLDEPTVLAMNMIGLDFNAVGNHEFDRGRAELLRMQRGGCERNTVRTPCAVDPDFPGARFGFLAANVRTEAGATLLPASAIRRVGEGPGAVTIGLIGLTLTETATLVSPGGVAGLSFEDEADSINALIPALKAQGVDAVVVLIHQGLATTVPYDDKSCGGVSGDLLPILARLDTRVDLVVSGHTHNAYLCDYGRIDPTRPFLVTSAGRYGTLLTDITLSIDPATRRVIARDAEQVIVQGEGHRGPAGDVKLTDAFPRFDASAPVAALVARYAAAAAPITSEVVGRMAGPALRDRNDAGESVLGDIVADAQLAAMQASEDGAQIALTNSGSLRADIVPDAQGRVTYGQIFAAQPFGNMLSVRTYTGAQLRAILEQQFSGGDDGRELKANILAASQGFTFTYDPKRPAGERVREMRLNDQSIREDGRYRVVLNSFLATGGDGFTAFSAGTEPVDGPLDIDALKTYLSRAVSLPLPRTGRIVRLD